MQLLVQEGVTLVDGRRADPAQRLTADELADLAGLSHDEVSEPDSDLAEAELRGTFAEIVRATHGAGVAAAAGAVMDHWLSVGGSAWLAGNDQAACRLTLAREASAQEPVHAWVLHAAAGTIELPLAELKRRPPFDEPDARREFITACTLIPGVHDPRRPPRPLEGRPPTHVRPFGTRRSGGAGTRQVGAELVREACSG